MTYRYRTKTIWRHWSSGALRRPELTCAAPGSAWVGVTALPSASPAALPRILPVWHPTRLNVHYQPALRLAELVLRGGSFEPEPGTIRLDGFLMDMNRVFEDFVTGALGDALRRYGGRVQPQDTRHHLDTGKQIGLRPDLVWYTNDRKAIGVADAKYKADKDGRYPESDLYQMLAYCTRLGLDRGHLIYAAGPRPVTTHRIANSEIAITQHALTLEATPQQVLSQIAAIAEQMAERLD
ncbi:hypothetical protein KGA66_21550 [Actinocrinis puniceicyclus]|uniref:Restriction endonuclease n=1 Tax=Actinocrinis puniceicyclus TaxID=977794 RepID=A0A8J7WNI5_9ACTN|nr:hypothetical protein [Actinocrinis puniceicyclus]MBS2965651.1 hypothetical protein [Actinocrinis puniceicyclus]